MPLNFTIKNIEQKKNIDVGFIIYDSLLFDVLNITDSYKKYTDISEFISDIQKSDFTQIDSEITSQDLFITYLNKLKYSANETDIRKIDFYFNYILDSLHYNYNLVLINASTENNVYEALSAFNLVFLTYDPLKTSISSNIKNEVAKIKIPLLLNTSIDSATFRTPEKYYYIDTNLSDINLKFSDFYLRSEVNSEDFNQMTFNVCGVKRIKRYFSDENITNDEEYSNNPYVLISVLSDISGIFSRLYSTNAWLNPANLTNGKVLNQNFTTINLPKIFTSEDFLPKTPSDVSLSSNSEIGIAHSRGINTILKYNNEYYLSSDFSGEYANVISEKRSVTFTNLVSFISRKGQSIINRYIFDANKPELRSFILSKMNNIMEEIKTKNGVSYYYVICDSTNNTEEIISAKQFIVDIAFTPIQGETIINLNFNT